MKSALVFVGALACIAMAGVPAAAQSCVDLINPNTGVSDCPARKHLCTNPTYFALMTQQCPKTCDRCTAVTSCVDLINPATGASDCPSRATLCNNPTYFTVMTQQCPKTCGRCPSVAPPTTSAAQSCVDAINPSTGVSDCAKNAALCNNPTYSTVMSQQCPKTCGRCVA